MQYFLPIYFLVYFGLAFVLPTVRVWRKTGKNPLVLGRSGSAHDFIGLIFKLLYILLAAIIVIYAVSQGFYQYLKPFGRLDRLEMQVAGIVLLVSSLVWIILAQFQMRESWRIGVDYKTKTKLVRTGIFAFSRNPIFLGMQATLLGFFFVMPNAFTLLILVLGVVLIHIQVRLEEEFLSQTHAADYDEYRRNVRRWL